jgi:hypothetical protein
MVMAQEEHGEAGVYADYTRFHNLNNQNFWGIGGRVAFNLNRYAQIEASMAYDFERNFTTTTSNSFNTSFTNTKFRMLEGMFGPKLQTGAGPFKLFGTVKAGFENFSLTNSGVPTGFTGAVSNVPDGNTHFALYPGGGIELFAHWIGIRAEVGDQIYWENGANHNLKFSVGPQFRW